MGCSSCKRLALDIQPEEIATVNFWQQTKINLFMSSSRQHTWLAILGAMSKVAYGEINFPIYVIKFLKLVSKICWLVHSTGGFDFSLRFFTYHSFNEWFLSYLFGARYVPPIPDTQHWGYFYEIQLWVQKVMCWIVSTREVAWNSRRRKHGSISSCSCWMASAGKSSRPRSIAA